MTQSYDWSDYYYCIIMATIIPPVSPMEMMMISLVLVPSSIYKLLASPGNFHVVSIIVPSIGVAQVLPC